LQLAKDFGWEDFQNPGGGCLLTDINFTKKLREFLEYNSLHVEDIDILKNGRHLRLPDGAKLVIGRDKDENQLLENAQNSKFIEVRVDKIPGPFGLLSYNASQKERELSARLILTFAKTTSDTYYGVHVGGEAIKSMPLAKRKDAHSYFAIQ